MKMERQRQDQLPQAGSLQRIPLAELRFDPQNPRLPEKSRMDENGVLEWMLRDAEILDLMQSIAASGYYAAEPILVTHLPDEAGYTVVEGNRRLAALKLLAEPGRASLRKKNVTAIAAKSSIRGTTPIPALVYGNRDDILDYLGYRHITGVKPWGPRQKAEYLKQLLQSRTRGEAPAPETLEIVSEMIGSKPHYARKLLTTLAVVELAEENAFWGSEFLERIDANFSVFHTALSYANIRDYVGLDDTLDNPMHNITPEKTKDVLEWVCGDKKIIRESRELKRLSAVVGSPKALEKLKSGLSLEIAAEYTGEALEDLRNFLKVALSKLSEADRLLTHIQKFTGEDVENARDVANLARKISNYVSHADA
jgi:hypothetical protein